MAPFFPLMLFGGGLLLATKGGKKKVSTFKLIETGSMGRLPTIDQPLVTIDLRLRQMIEIVAAASPSSNWVQEVEGTSVKVEKHTRMQDSVTQLSTFTLKALSVGDSRIVFKKIGHEGEIAVAHHLRIAVME